MKSEWDSLLLPGGVSRRKFVAGSLAAGFVLAVRPMMAQAAMTTRVDGLEASGVKIPTQNGEIPAYRAQPLRGKKWPTVLVVQEMSGDHEYMEDICRRLARRGYQAIAPNLLARYGDVRQHNEVHEQRLKIPDTEALADLDACVEWAQQQGGHPGRLGITGFCWGGRVTWLYCAHQPKVKAGVAWYGRLEGDKTELTPHHPMDVVDELKAPVLGLYAGADADISRESIERMRKALATGNASAKASRFKVYRNAPHAFHANDRSSFRREEAADGWKRMLEWFKKKGV